MQILKDVVLADHTTLRLGGAARFFVSVSSIEELRDAVAYAHTHSLPFFVLGGGSNVLFSDAGWDGLVVHMEIRGREYEEGTQGDARVTAGAGEVWDDLVAETVSQGLWGMENLSSIPGTVGATPVQNVGAYGVEVKDIIEWVEVLDPQTGELHILSTSECAFGYRDSIFKRHEGLHYIVTRVAYRLSTHPYPRLAYKDLRTHFGERTDPTVEEMREAVRSIRANKFPDLAQIGTAGSFFKNPIISKSQLAEMAHFAGDVPHHEVDATHVKIPLAWMLEHLGWKGKREGHVGCWDAQPLILVHYGGGTAGEFILFAHAIMQDVKEHFAIKIEPEVKIALSHT
jgi:UDP-N-acetylmuramate dehydrogenase